VGGDEQEIMGKMEQIILMQKIENQQYNCLAIIEKSTQGSWAFNFWTYTFEKLDKNYKLIKNREGNKDD
jgi:hypothetical protein